MPTINTQNAKIHFNIAIVISRFNENIGNRLLTGAQQRLQELGFADKQITIVWTPGEGEIPLLAQHLARTKKYAAIICLGTVIRGETTHYDSVCDRFAQGCLRVSLDHNLPVIQCVLTTENEEQALARSGGDHGNYGQYAVDAAVEMVAAFKAIEELH